MYVTNTLRYTSDTSSKKWETSILVFFSEYTESSVTNNNIYTKHGQMFNRNAFVLHRPKRRIKYVCPDNTSSTQFNCS